MPADSGRTPRRKREAGSDGLDTSAELTALARRTKAFAALVVILAGVTLWFVVTAVKGGGNKPLSATTSCTVRLGVLDAKDRRKAEDILRSSAMASLAQGHRLYLQEVPGGRLALCAGRFQSRDSPEAAALLARVKDYRLDGKQVFASAIIWSYTQE